jgi:hypothetical protein
MVISIRFVVICDLNANRPLFIAMQANGQLRTWFEDDDALERAINGEYVSNVYIFLTIT